MLVVTHLLLFSGVLFGALSSGASKMQMLAQVPDAMVEITQSLIILFILIMPGIRSRLQTRVREKNQGKGV